MAEQMLFADEVAEAIGVQPKNIKFYLYDGNRARKLGTATEATFPAPADTVSRPVWNGHHNINVASNRWRASDIAAWVEARPKSAQWPEARREAVAAKLRGVAA